MSQLANIKSAWLRQRGFTRPPISGFDQLGKESLFFGGIPKFLLGKDFASRILVFMNPFFLDLRDRARARVACG
jgi:hypothetical protein